MAKDVKNRIPAFRTSKRKPQNRLWITVGLLGALILFGISWALKHAPTNASPPQLPPPVAAPIPTESGPRFAYFRILEDRERQVPENLINEEERNLRIGKPSAKGAFSLLIGTFKVREEANAARKQLSGFDAIKPHMQEVTLEFASWYRIKAGPYGTLSDALRVRAFLRDHGFDSVVMTEANP
jgi:cell division protein FtsN